jgi:hypothetical protein
MVAEERSRRGLKSALVVLESSSNLNSGATVLTWNLASPLPRIRIGELYRSRSRKFESSGVDQ